MQNSRFGCTFNQPVETVAEMNFEEQMKMIDICAVGPLRITAALVNAGVCAGRSDRGPFPCELFGIDKVLSMCWLWL